MEIQPTGTPRTLSDITKHRKIKEFVSRCNERIQQLEIRKMKDIKMAFASSIVLFYITVEV